MPAQFFSKINFDESFVQPCHMLLLVCLTQQNYDWASPRFNKNAYMLKEVKVKKIVKVGSFLH